LLNVYRDGCKTWALLDMVGERYEWLESDLTEQRHEGGASPYVSHLTKVHNDSMMDYMYKSVSLTVMD